MSVWPEEVTLEQVIEGTKLTYVSDVIRRGGLLKSASAYGPSINKNGMYTSAYDNELSITGDFIEVTGKGIVLSMSGGIQILDADYSQSSGVSAAADVRLEIDGRSLYRMNQSGKITCAIDDLYDSMDFSDPDAVITTSAKTNIPLIFHESFRIYGTLSSSAGMYNPNGNAWYVKTLRRGGVSVNYILY